MHTLAGQALGTNVKFPVIFGCKTQDDEEAARLVAVGAGRVTGAAAPVNKRVKDRQTVFASATVPQHNHFIRQCVQVSETARGWPGGRL